MLQDNLLCPFQAKIQLFRLGQMLWRNSKMQKLTKGVFSVCQIKATMPSFTILASNIDTQLRLRSFIRTSIQLSKTWSREMWSKISKWPNNLCKGFQQIPMNLRRKRNKAIRSWVKFLMMCQTLFLRTTGLIWAHNLKWSLKNTQKLNSKRKMWQVLKWECWTII